MISNANNMSWPDFKSNAADSMVSSAISTLTFLLIPTAAAPTLGFSFHRETGSFVCEREREQFRKK